MMIKEKNNGLGNYPLSCTRWLFASVNSSSNCWKSASSMSRSSIVRFPMMRRYLAGLSTCPCASELHQSKVHKDSASFGLIKKKTLLRSSPTKPSIPENLPQHVQCLIGHLVCAVHSQCCVHDVQDCQRILPSAVTFLQLRSSHPLKQRH